jgi:hypothetical protein
MARNLAAINIGVLDIAPNKPTDFFSAENVFILPFNAPTNLPVADIAVPRVPTKVINLIPTSPIPTILRTLLQPPNLWISELIFLAVSTTLFLKFVKLVIILGNCSLNQVSACPIFIEINSRCLTMKLLSA